MEKRCGKLIRRTAAGVLLAALLISGVPAITSASNVPTVTKKLELKAGDTGKIKVSGKNISSSLFESSNTKIAKVSKNGTVTAKKKGSCKIKVTVRFIKSKSLKKLSIKKYQCAVKVTDGSSKPEQEETQKQEVKASPFVRQNADFSVKLLQNNAAEALKKGENVLVSPESVLCALAMTANGAAGDTLSEMQSVLCGDMSLDEFNKNMSEFNQKLTGSDKVKFSIADSIWIRDNAERIQMKEDFLALNKKYYDAESFLAAFDSKTVQDINGWVKNHTNNMIDKLIDEISDDAVAYLINAIAFEGKWKLQYQDDDIMENQDFTNAAGVKEKATMLVGSEREYICDDKAKGFIKGYEGNRYAFMAILPNKGVSVSDYLQQLTGEKLLSLYQNRKYNYRVNTKMPEFSYDYSSCLRETLEKMGIHKAFMGEADFSNMAVTDTGYLYIDEVLHKTHIELDRNGTKAAAVTAVIMEAAAAVTEKEVNVSLTRPFLYAIIDTETGIPVFMGAVNTVAGK